MHFTILWVLLFAWILACLFYFVRIKRILRSKGVSFSTLMGRSYKGSDSAAKARKLFTNIIIATIISVIGILIAYFVRGSS